MDGAALQWSAVGDAHRSLISQLVVVADLYIERVAIFEPKADAPLVIDRYRVLAGAVALQRMEAVT